MTNANTGIVYMFIINIYSLHNILEIARDNLKVDKCSDAAHTISIFRNNFILYIYIMHFD